MIDRIICCSNPNMKKHIFSVIPLFMAISSLAQIQDEVGKVLAKKNFVEFKSYADQLSKNRKGVTSYWENLRELTNGYQEGVFYFEQSIPHKENPAISSVSTFRVTILTSFNSIIFYHLGEKKNKRVGKDWVPYFDTIVFYKNDSLYAELKSSFKKTFGAVLNEKELFLNSIIYGSSCGYAGMDPYEKTQIDLLVKNQDKKSLLKWVQSTNTEKQVYGVDGLYQLKKQGIKFSEFEIGMINAVLEKKGTIQVCEGCIHSTEEISVVTKKIKF